MTKTVKNAESDFKLTSKPLDTLIINSEAGKRELTGPDHWGIDLKTKDVNDHFVKPVYAAHDGLVIKASWANYCNEQEKYRGYGRVVVIKDNVTGMLTLYAHLSDYLVHKNDSVVAGQQIALSGDSGHITGPHLHFEVIDGNKIVGSTPIWKTIQDSADGINTFSTKHDKKSGRELKGGTLGISDEVERLQPRLFLADLAINLARQELGSIATQQEVEARSCQIFDCNVIAKSKSVSLQGDRRANNYIRAADNTKNLEFRFPDISQINFDIIDTKEVRRTDRLSTVSKLILDKKEVSYKASPCACARNQDGSPIGHRWIMNHNGKNYNLVRVNASGQEDDNGSDLIILASEQNSIKIKNFNFNKIQKTDEEVGVEDFGINLEQVEMINREFQVAVYHLGSGNNPAVMKLDNGNFVVGWVDISAYSQKILMQIFNPFGNKIGNWFEITGSTPYTVKMAKLQNGDFVASYNDYGSLPDSLCDIFVQRFDINGNKVGNRIRVSSYNYQSNCQQSIASLAGGGFVVVWNSQDNKPADPYDGIYVQIFDDNVNKIGNIFVANSYITDPQILPSVTSLANGNFVVSWDSWRQNGPLYGTFMQIFSANGNKIGHEFQADIDGAGKSNVQVIALPNSGFAAFWNEYQDVQGASIGGVIGTSAQIFDAFGNRVGSKRIMTSGSSYVYDGSTYFYDSIYNLSDGNLIATFVKTEAAFPQGNTFAQIISPSLAKIGGEFNIGGSAPRSGFVAAAVTSLENEKFVAVWSRYLVDQELKFNVFAKIFDPNALPGQAPICSAVAQISSSASPQSITLEQGVTYIGASNDDTFIIPSEVGTVENPITYTIGNFRLQGNDIIDLSNLLASVAKNQNSDKQANQLQISVFPRDQSTVITVNGSDVEVILQDYDIKQFELEYVVSGGVDITSEIMTIENLKQSLNYNQLDTTVTLEDLRINATNPQTIVDVELTLVDSDGNVISDPDQLLIQIGETDSGKMSTFVEGVWRANGTIVEVNDLLSNLKLELGLGFEENFGIDVDIAYNGNQILRTTSEIEVSYQCQQLPPEIQELIDSQVAEKGKELVLDMVRYFFNPENSTSYDQLVFDIQSRIDQGDFKQGGCLDILTLNQTAFKIISDCQGIYNLTATAQNYCGDTEYQDFDLIVADIIDANSPSPSPSASSSARQDHGSRSEDGQYIIIGATVGGGAILLLTALCYAYKKFPGIKNLFAANVRSDLSREDMLEMQNVPSPSPAVPLSSRVNSQLTM